MNYLTACGTLASILLTAACSGGGSGRGVPVIADPGVFVPDDPAFDTYARNDTGDNRVLSNVSLPGDAAVLAQFDDANPNSPAGYRSLIALNQAYYRGDVRIEVIAQVTGAAPATRLLRLTADQAPLEQVPGVAGRYFLRGDNFAWVTIDDGPLLTGSDSRGLVGLVLDFDTGRADIDLRTGVAGASVVRTEINVTGLPFNIRSGAFGGPIAVSVNDPDSPAIYQIGGTLRGTVGGTPDYDDSIHGLTASGLYTARATDQGAVVRIDGAFAGTDPNVLP